MRQMLQFARRARTAPAPRRALVEVRSRPVAGQLALLVGCGLLVLMQLYVAIPLVPVLNGVFRSDRAAVALSTTYGLSYGIGLAVFGPLSDRYGRKVLLVPGMAAVAVATTAVAVAPSIGALGVLRAVQGLLAASFAAVALPYVAEALPPRWRATAVGAISTAFLVAGIAGQVYAQAVAGLLGWRWVFGLAAPAFALLALGLGLGLVEAVVARREGSLAQTYRDLGHEVMRRELALPFLAMATVLFSFVAMYAALAAALGLRFGLGHTGLQLVRLAGLPGMAVAPLAGRLVDRFGALAVAVTGFGVAAAGLLLEAATAGVLWLLVPASTVFVAGIASIVPSMITLMSLRAGVHRGGALAVGGLFLFTGASCGPLVAGVASFATLVVALAGLLLLGGALVLASRSRSSVGAPP